MSTKTSDTELPGSGPDPSDPDADLPAEVSGEVAAERGREAASLPGEETEAARTYRDRWLRSEAEMQNVRRRAQRDVEESRRFAEDRMLLATIDQLDDLERALDAARSAGAPESWTAGVELAARGMRDHLARHGASEVAAVGAPFDPAVHEAMLEVDAPQGIAPGHVVQVASRGYQRGGRALRPARVIVARGAGA